MSMERVFEYRSPGGQRRGSIRITEESGGGIRVRALEVGQPRRHRSGAWVVTCRCLGLIGSGATPEAARSSIETTVRGYVETVLEVAGKEVLMKEVQSRGWRLVEAGGPGGAVSPLTVEPDEVAYDVEAIVAA